LLKINILVPERERCQNVSALYIWHVRLKKEKLINTFINISALLCSTLVFMQMNTWSDKWQI